VLLRSYFLSFVYSGHLQACTCACGGAGALLRILIQLVPLDGLARCVIAVQLHEVQLRQEQKLVWCVVLQIRTELSQSAPGADGCCVSEACFWKAKVQRQQQPPCHVSVDSTLPYMQPTCGAQVDSSAAQLGSVDSGTTTKAGFPTPNCL